MPQRLHHDLTGLRLWLGAIRPFALDGGGVLDIPVGHVPSSYLIGIADRLGRALCQVADGPITAFGKRDLILHGVVHDHFGQVHVAGVLHGDRVGDILTHLHAGGRVGSLGDLQPGPLGGDGQVLVGTDGRAGGVVLAVAALPACQGHGGFGDVRCLGQRHTTIRQLRHLVAAGILPVAGQGTLPRAAVGDGGDVDLAVDYGVGNITGDHRTHSGGLGHIAPFGCIRTAATIGIFDIPLGIAEVFVRRTGGEVGRCQPGGAAIAGGACIVTTGDNGFRAGQIALSAVGERAVLHLVVDNVLPTVGDAVALFGGIGDDRVYQSVRVLPLCRDDVGVLFSGGEHGGAPARKSVVYTIFIRANRVLGWRRADRSFAICPKGKDCSSLQKCFRTVATHPFDRIAIDRGVNSY